jgi:hypothetical protein
MLVDILVFPFRIAKHGLCNVFVRDETLSPSGSNEISVNGNLCYCSGKKKRSNEDKPSGSEEIEKSAIKGYLI